MENNPFIQTGDISRAKKHIHTYKQVLNEKGAKVSRKFTKGTLVMTIAANIGDVSILTFDSYFPDSIVAFLTKENSDYFYYLFEATKHELDTVKVTNTQDNLNLERLNGLFKLHPPTEEQTRIAAYLDRHTALLDRKIDLLQRKIDRYQELKKSLINETVCRGLDNNTPMKDSGVAWIGKVPAHWEVKRLKDVAELKFSNVDKKTYDNQKGVLLCNYVDVYKNDFIDESIDFMKSTASNNEIRRFQLRIWDVLATKDSESHDDIAVPALVTTMKKNLLCGYHLAMIRTKKEKLSGAFLFRLLQAGRFNYGFSIAAKGITRVGLSISSFNDALVFIPPMNEQEQITNYLKLKTSQIDAIIRTLHSQIEKLRELRKTLINDVVTGKLKVPE